MSSMRSTRSETPGWLSQALGLDGALAEGATFTLGALTFEVHDGIPRARDLLSSAQGQTAETFGFKWQLRETFESPAALGRVRDWLIERYGPVADAPWWDGYGDRPLLLDAGCGAGMSGLALFGDRLHKVRYLGVDVSSAVDVAAARFAEAGVPGAWLQADLSDLPLPEASVDVVFSEGVLHHTDSTQASFRHLASLLAPGGRFLLYVYRKKGPIREFTDDYVRARLQELAPEQAWAAVLPLTKLGKALGELDVTVDVPEDVPLLGIPAGPISLQRLFYWHVFKAFYRPELELEELNHINYDWYAPANAHRHTEAEVRSWCDDLGLEVEHEDVQEAGITVIARKQA